MVNFPFFKRGCFGSSLRITVLIYSFVMIVSISTFEIIKINKKKKKKKIKKDIFIKYINRIYTIKYIYIYF